MAKKRKVIPKLIENSVMLKSEGKCYCGEIGDQIHHIDEDPANNDFDNLILLCFNHHDDASVKNGLKKRLKPIQLKHRRNEMYLQNERKKSIELKHYAKTLRKLSEENIFKASIDASIIMEIIRVKKVLYDELDWKKINRILLVELYAYSRYSNWRIFDEVIDFLEDISYHSRAKIPDYVVDAILNLIMVFFPRNIKSKEKAIAIQIAERCCNIASKIAYDAFIHSNNMAVASSALNILKYMQMIANHDKIPEISAVVKNNYKELERHLNRPERNDLDMARKFLTTFKNDLSNSEMIYPEMDKKMEERLDKDSQEFLD